MLDLIRNKKGMITVGQIPTIVMLVAVGVLILAFVMQILGDVSGDMDTDSAEQNATELGITGLGNIAAKWGTIGTLVAVGVIIGLLFGVFPTGKGR